MAGENDVLGTSGKDAIPFEYQVEEQQIARKRALAQAMYAKSMQPMAAPERFGNHVAQISPWAHVANAITGYMGQKGMQDADASSQALAGRMGSAQKADIAKVMALANGSPGSAIPNAGPTEEGYPGMPGSITPATPPDLRGASAMAMQSQFPRVNAYGMDLQKDMRSQVAEQMKLLAVADPGMAVKRSMSGNPFESVPDIAPPSVQFGQDPSGNAYGVSQDKSGKRPTLTFAPKATNVNLTTAAKTNEVLDKANVDQIEAGKKSLSGVNVMMADAIRANELANKGADIGGGASLRQGARKLAQSFGVDSPETGLTDELRGRLGGRLLEEVRKVAPVTEHDIPLVQSLVGSMDTDPKALKELSAWIMAKSLMSIDKHNALVDSTAETSSGDPRKYMPFKVTRPTIDTKDPNFLGRAYQLMQESGHDLSGYNFGGQPITPDTKFNIDFGAASPAPLPGQMPARFKRVQ